jgi:hypothetical protein
VDSAGQIVLAGSNLPELDFGAGPIQGRLFAAKFDAAGSVIWSYDFDGYYTGPTTTVTGVAVDWWGSIRLTGTSSEDISFGGCRLNAQGPFSTVSYIVYLPP